MDVKLTQVQRPGMPGLRLEHLENIHDRITEGLNQGFGKITDRLDALDPAGLFSRDQTFIRFNSFEHRVTYFHLKSEMLSTNPINYTNVEISICSMKTIKIAKIVF